MLRNGQRGPGSYQVVTGIMRETAGLTQSAGRTHTEEGEKTEGREMRGQMEES